MHAAQPTCPFLAEKIFPHRLWASNLPKVKPPVAWLDVFHALVYSFALDDITARQGTPIRSLAALYDPASVATGASAQSQAVAKATAVREHMASTFAGLSDRLIAFCAGIDSSSLGPWLSSSKVSRSQQRSLDRDLEALTSDLSRVLSFEVALHEILTATVGGQINTPDGHLSSAFLPASAYAQPETSWVRRAFSIIHSRETAPTETLRAGLSSKASVIFAGTTMPVSYANLAVVEAIRRYPPGVAFQGSALAAAAPEVSGATLAKVLEALARVGFIKAATAAP